ncbi:ATP-binding protein involved in chromosome partitioning [Halobiforma haloterrestris]|uniref:ATP-binding protein involved in chromosome partitioning n=1 Tax=Natronobacterium haloterrestre TaxID=148448 RepID=A0A1I1CZP3_NATHA|nr:P-loop NTPase [Halobiforma haloterrestris]SFB68135.1 ATP-binding protein involved in chromosome partitioning [Halobiforma haloterrestris]
MTGSSDAVDPFRSIELPDGSDPVSKGIVRRIRANDGTVTVEVAIDGLGDDLAERIVEQIRGAALAMPEADHVRIQPLRDPDKDVDLPTVDHVLAVASAKGGVGKTTVAVALARTLAARGLDVGLFDADIYGPNVPHLLEDVEGPVLTNGSGQPVPLETDDGLQVLSPGVVGGDAPTARRGAIAYGAVENLLGQGAWDERDVLIIDMPAGTDDVVGAALEHVPVDGAVFVTTPFDASVDDTHRTVDLFEENGVAPVAAVVNMNGFDCECCGERNRLFEDPVDLAVPAVHELPFDRDLQSNPGGEEAPEAVDDLADSVESFVDDVLEAVPEGALDLRGLPPASQARQLSDELAAAGDGDTVSAVVEDPTEVRETIRSDAPDLLAGTERKGLSTTGGLLELTRA